MPHDSITPTYRFDKSFQVKIPTREEWKDNKVLPHNSGLTWFSDGSKINGFAGSGIYCPQTQVAKSFALGSHTTIFQSETFGISYCCKELLKINCNNIPISICSDSQSSLKAISAYKIYSSQVLECRDYVQKLASNNQVSLIWVPGHSNIQGNEIAIDLARSGAESVPPSPKPCAKVTSSFLKNHIIKWKRITFFNHWNSIEHARQSKNCIKINAKNTKYILSLSRKNIRRMTGILTGHCPLNKHLHTIGLSNSPLCTNCGDVESAEHFLCKCPAYISARAKCLGNFILPHNIIWSLPLNNILDYLNRTNKI